MRATSLRAGGRTFAGFNPPTRLSGPPTPLGWGDFRIKDITMASRSTNTMPEALQKMLRDIADMKTLPDADNAFLVTIESMILERLRQPVEMLQQSGQLPPSSQPPQLPGTAPLQGGGLMNGTQAPNPDELNRMLSAGAGGLQ